jgi:hypothetical protein
VRAREEAKVNPLISLRLETTLGARYVFPDMTHEQFDNLIEQLDASSSQLIFNNISKATLVLPLRILSNVSVLHPLKEGEHATYLTAACDVIWRP